MVRKGWSVLCAEKDYWEGALMVTDMLLTFTSMVRDGKPTTEGYGRFSKKWYPKQTSFDYRIFINCSNLRKVIHTKLDFH